MLQPSTRQGGVRTLILQGYPGPQVQPLHHLREALQGMQRPKHAARLQGECGMSSSRLVCRAPGSEHSPLSSCGARTRAACSSLTCAGPATGPRNPRTPARCSAETPHLGQRHKSVTRASTRATAHVERPDLLLDALHALELVVPQALVGRRVEQQVVVPAKRASSEQSSGTSARNRQPEAVCWCRAACGVGHLKLSSQTSTSSAKCPSGCRPDLAQDAPILLFTGCCCREAHNFHTCRRQPPGCRWRSRAP